MILVLSDLWPPFPGGAERLAFNLARDLMWRGEDVQVITGYEAAQQLDGPPVTALPIGIRGDHDAGVKLLAAHLDEAWPDLILTHHLYAYEFAAELEGSRIPVVQVVLNGSRLPFAALAVFISEHVRRQQPALEPQDLVIHPFAVAADVVAESHAPRLGFIKPIPHKGVELIYELAARLPEREFLILRGEWQDLEVIRQLPNVSFMQPVVDIRDFYREVDVLLVPSLSEDAGTVAQEATLNGLPCLSSNVQGLRETNAGGLQLDPRDARAWVQAIQALDDPRALPLLRRAEVVRNQLAAGSAYDWPGKLDELHTRLRRLMP